MDNSKTIASAAVRDTGHGRFRADCPFDDNCAKGLLFLYPDGIEPVFHCFSCGEHGTYAMTGGTTYVLRAGV